jgi:hypothetical protein
MIGPGAFGPKRDDLPDSLSPKTAGVSFYRLKPPLLAVHGSWGRRIEYRRPHVSTLELARDDRAVIAPNLPLALLCTATFLQNRETPTMSRHWHSVSKPIQQLAAGLHPVMSEGMSPYEIYYVLATDEEIQRLSKLSVTMGIH